MSQTYTEEEIAYAVKCSREAHTKMHGRVRPKDAVAQAIAKHFHPLRLAEMTYNPLAR